MSNRALFGPGGNSQAFYDAGYKETKKAPEYLVSVGLDAYEFEAGNGLTTGDATLAVIGKNAAERNIHMSFHTPYFISLSGVDPEKRLNSVKYIADSVHAASLLGAKTIVVHTGSAAKITREEAMRLAADTLDHVLNEVGEPDIKIGLETMGKKNQLGTLDEVITLCKIDPRLCPVVDFGHLNARDCGNVFLTPDDYYRVFDAIGDTLGDDTAKYLHCHFSKIEWTAAGEKRHLTFEDTVYGPDYYQLMETIARHGLCPTVISESAGTQSEDALAMKNAYLQFLG